MTKIQPTHNRKPKPISAKLILTGAVAVLLFSLLLSSVIGLMGKYTAMRKHISALKEEQSSLKEKQDSVTKMNDYINTPEGKEYIFRDKYRVVKPGEQMIVITKEPEKDTESSSKTPPLKRFWNSILSGLGLY